MFKKRKQKIISEDKSTIKYWQEVIKPRMKLNNNKLNHSSWYHNFIVPDKFQIVNNYGTINISYKDASGNSSWYHIYKDGISAEIIKEDFMTNPCAEINIKF